MGVEFGMSAREEWIDIDGAPEGTARAIQQAFDHRNFDGFFSIKAGAAPDGSEACYVLENSHKADSLHFAKLHQSKLLQYQKDVARCDWDASNEYFLPLDADDIRRLHRIVSVGIAGTGFVLEPSSETALVNRYDADAKGSASVHYRPEYEREDPILQAPVTKLRNWARPARGRTEQPE